MTYRYLLVSVTSCASFLTFYKYISPALSIRLLPGYINLPRSRQVEWNSRTNSSVHAFLVSILCLYSLIYEDEISQDPVWGESDLVRVSCAIVVGYMLSDVFILLLHYSEMGEIFYIFHHAASIYAFCFAMTYGALLWFANIRLVAEFSTPFANARWFLGALGFLKDSPAYAINGVLMTIVFFFVRIVSIPFYWHKVFAIYGTEQANLLGNIWYVLISSCLVLDLINIYWFYRIGLGIYKLVHAYKNKENMRLSEFSTSRSHHRSSSFPQKSSSFPQQSPFVKRAPFSLQSHQNPFVSNPSSSLHQRHSSATIAHMTTAESK